MPPTRRKAPRQQAPQTIEEAAGLLGKYAGMLTEVEQLRADADAAIAEIQAARDAALAPIEEEAKAIFLQLRAWWGVAGDTLTEGKRKSHELAGCILGERTTPPSLKMPGKVEECAVKLLSAGLAEFCRIKAEVDKPAVLKALGSWPELERLLRDAGADDYEQLKHIANTAPADEGNALDDLVARVGPVVRLQDLGFRATQKDEFFIDRAAPKPAAVEEVREAAE